MTISKRERLLTIALLAACGAFVVDRVAISPYLSRRNELVLNRESMQTNLAEAHQTLRDERRLKKELAGIERFFKLDPSDAEGRLLALLQQSDQMSGVSGASFQRVGIVEEHGFTRLTFQATVIGKMSSVAAFLYRIETASMPIRVDDVLVAPKLESGDDLQVHFSVSTLCRGKENPRPHSESGPDVALVDRAGGQP
jgi:Tfp pilus assembly protein PilO